MCKRCKWIYADEFYQQVINITYFCDCKKGQIAAQQKQLLNTIQDNKNKIKIVDSKQYMKNIGKAFNRQARQSKKLNYRRIIWDEFTENYNL